VTGVQTCALPICFSHMKEIIKPSGYWTKEKCIEDISKHETKKSWRDSFGGAYYSAHKNGWLNECYAHVMHKEDN